MGKRGPSPGTGGRPSKPLADKIAEGNPGKRPLKVMEFKDLPDMQGEEMPKPSEMLSATQKDGRVLQAKEIYEQTWDWLNKRGCVAYISPQTLERYAMAAARWKHCEEIITATGYLAKHPTTGGAMTSPYVSVLDRIIYLRLTGCGMRYLPLFVKTRQQNIPGQLIRMILWSSFYARGRNENDQ